MAVVRESCENALAELPTIHNDSATPMFSSVTGQLVKAGELDPSYWTTNLVSPVKFTDAVQTLLRHTGDACSSLDREAFANIFLEIEPHSALRGYLLDIFRDEAFSNLSYSNALRKNYEADETILRAVGELWCRGCDIKLDAVDEIV